jgi:DNA-binding IclR family transcriptional regulator
MTVNTITATDKLIAELRWVRANGFGVDNEEYAIGLRCVAAPIRDHSGAIIAAASVALPITRANADQLTDALLALVRGTSDISRKLGCDAALLGIPAAVKRSELQLLIEDKLRSWDVLSAVAN